MKFCLQVARRTVEIQTDLIDESAFAPDYICKSECPDLIIELYIKDDIDNQLHQYTSTIIGGRRKTFMEIDVHSVKLKIHEMLSSAIINCDTFMMHGAVVAYKEKAYIFTAPSGTGKTTHVRKWLDNLPDAFVVNGDKPFIITGDTPMACGSPWCGKERWQTNTQVPLAAIVLMERGEENEIREISFKEAFPGLLRQTYQPKETDKLIKTL